MNEPSGNFRDSSGAAADRLGARGDRRGDEGRPQRLLLHVVKAHDGAAIEAMATAYLAPSARVVSDGLGCSGPSFESCTPTNVISVA